MKAIRALGVKIEKDERIDCEPDHGSAGYSYLGIKRFAEKVGEKLKSQVMIGDRILVFSKTWKRPGDFLDKAIQKGVKVWTKEMLEPTISALYMEKNEGDEAQRGGKIGRKSKKLRE
jgi:hypothetical protein